jgi:hypothetical protein
MDDDVEITPSNRGHDNAGEFLGLPGNTSYPLVGAVFITAVLITIIAQSGASFAYYPFALIPLVLTCLVVFSLIFRKPKGYLMDWIGHHFLGASKMTYNARAQDKKRSPLTKK